LKITIPENIRIQRIQRQFDESDYLYEKYEFRNILASMLLERNEECRCIRCQEIKTYKSKFEIHLKEDYTIFINQISNKYYYFAAKSRREPQLLLGYLKLNLGTKAIIREIKVVGKSSKVGQVGQFQGHGIGEFLMHEVEKFVVDKGFSNLFVNASPGARIFFENLKYCEANDFLSRSLYENT